MNTKYLLIVLLSCLLSLPVKSQNTELSGKWTCFKKETEDGNDGSNITLNGKPYECSLSIEFVNKRKALYGTGDNEPIELDYKVKGHDLFIGNKVFKIEQKNSNELILLEHKSNDLATIRFRYYLKKNEL